MTDSNRKQNLRVKSAINEFLQYGIDSNLLNHDDIDYVNNRLSNLLKIHPDKFKSVKVIRKIKEILLPFIEHAIKNKIIEKNDQEIDNFESLIMDLITPRPNELINQFYKFYKDNPTKATDYFYHLMIKNNYIKKERVDKNIKYDYFGKYGKMEITINVSKPEKTNKSVQKELIENTKNSYPSCVLCKENVGFYGNAKLSARSNLRTIPVTLNQESFQFQYSPYVYYQEHAIVLSSVHVPMKITKDTLVRLFDFVKIFPKYFLGSNAALPLVGGSILAHEHYQGGKYRFPIESAKYFKKYKHGKTELLLLKWPVSTIRLRSSSLTELINMGDKIRSRFEVYRDITAGIIPTTNTVKHNTITPIARKKKKYFELDIALRNNLTSKKYPDGIFHNHPDVHDVKKESIGLIEVMGLAILPARLETDLVKIEAYLKGKISTFNTIDLYPNLIKRLRKYGNQINKELIRLEVGSMFEKGLEDCGVFKQNEVGKKQFIRFIETKIID